MKAPVGRSAVLSLGFGFDFGLLGFEFV